MTNYRKLAACAAGLVAILGARYGLATEGTEAIIYDLILGALTLAGVYQLPNERN